MEDQPTCIAITAADARFFEMAQGCIQSLRAQRGGHLALAFFDLGCSDDQLVWLRSHVDVVVAPNWDFQFKGREQAPTHLKGLLARPFLPRYFPGFETYLWIDADAWVQDWSAVELLQQGARRRRGLAIIPEMDRGALTLYGRMPMIWKEKYGWYEQGHGLDIADQLHSYPLLNAGVFAMHREAPHWQVWANELQAALHRGGCTLPFSGVHSAVIR
jgi:hypothetical protein